MKRIIKKSTTITEMIIDNNGETFIIDRKHSVKTNSELVFRENIYEDEKVLDQIYRQEIAKEAEEYKKKNPSPQKEKDLPDTSNQKYKNLSDN
ncbi:MAG: hypothetical protein I3273_04970 [Candidatus Moeniiplasma glomeromycotorum]|nr:hypothetical protein [Candidatus Moeniiplasma glomeromycotorum]MCE8167894.1 hypothetical protein [Candidatus Moeniiplasma glomeromycotorum]MCE8169444.1 hypothetical protein [Candidatus Moeniiplasma glomeromycotorum]